MAASRYLGVNRLVSTTLRLLDTQRQHLTCWHA
jgi:hypothetical protein